MTNGFRRNLALLLTVVMTMGLLCSSAGATAKSSTDTSQTTAQSTLAQQSITASSYTKTVCAKPFRLKATTDGDGRLSYKSSNTKVATISHSGIVSIKRVGTTTITITASETAKYEKATLEVTITVDPNGTKLTSVRNMCKQNVKVKWQRNKTVTGYEIEYAASSNFEDAQTVTVQCNKVTCQTICGLEKNKEYYVHIRTYKNSGENTYYSSWSKVKTVFIRK